MIQTNELKPLKYQTMLKGIIKVVFKRVVRTSENGLWQITAVRSARLSHFSGWLVNTRTKVKYVFSVIDGRRINYMRMPTVVNSVPRYVDEMIYDLEDDFTSEEPMND